MRPRDDSLLSSGSDGWWSVVSLDDLPDNDVLSPAPDNDDEDGEEEEVPRIESTTSTTTSRKTGKTKTTKSVVRRNERERNRVKQVNQGFDRLRQYVRLPGLSKKKLSKVDTLRAAVVYIKQLQSLLAENSGPPTTYHYDTASQHHIEQLLFPAQQQLFDDRQHHEQQYQIDTAAAAAGDVTNYSGDFVVLSPPQTAANLSTESYDLSGASFCMIETDLHSLQPTICCPLSATSGDSSFTLTDINDNKNYIVSSTTSVASLPEADVINVTEFSEQQQRLSELTAWLMQ